jgi:hypothetical protein
MGGGIGVDDASDAGADDPRGRTVVAGAEARLFEKGEAEEHRLGLGGVAGALKHA